MRRKWTEETIAQVAAMIRDGFSYSKIGAEFGLTTNQIAGRVYRCAHLRRVSASMRPERVEPDDLSNLNWAQRRRAKINQGAWGRIDAGLQGMTGRLNQDEIASRLAEIPAEDRDTTGILMGDPPRHDPRRTWAPHLAGDA